SRPVRQGRPGSPPAPRRLLRLRLVRPESLQPPRPGGRPAAHAPGRPTGRGRRGSRERRVPPCAAPLAGRDRAGPPPRRAGRADRTVGPAAEVLRGPPPAPG